MAGGDDSLDSVRPSCGCAAESTTSLTNRRCCASESATKPRRSVNRREAARTSIESNSIE